MGAGLLTGTANLFIRQKQLREMEQQRALQRQKLGMPSPQQQAEIDSDIQALTMWPYLSLATKKAMMDWKADPHARYKYWRELNSYRQHATGLSSSLEQQLFMHSGEDQTSKDFRRLFTLAGNFYSVATPSLIRGTGMRGQYMMAGLDPHVPDFGREPHQIWERLPAIHARLKQNYDMSTAQPLYKDWLARSTQGAAKALPEYRKLFSDDEWQGLKPGIFSEVGKVPRSATFSRGKYVDVETFKEIPVPSPASLGRRPLPVLKSHYDPTAGPANTLEVPRETTPIGRIEP